MNIKKIMLIQPGIRYPRVAFAQPLGLLYLVSVLRQSFPDQFEIDLVEQALYNLNFEQMKERIKKFNPDLVGFSCMSVQANEMSELAKIVKELKPSCLTILGGPHASVFYDYVLERDKIDIIVIGEGERTFPELIEKLLNDKPINQIKGIAFKQNGQITVTPPREFIENLDNVPFPAWDLVDFKRYSAVESMHVYCHSTPWAAIFTSRGCPFHCAYCHKIFGKRARLRSPENVISELELLTGKYGVKEIHIVDDIFNLDLARAKKVCDLIVERGIKIKIAFPNGLRGDLMDRELIQKLKKAGCYSITYAVETASPRLQKLINRNLNLEKLRQVFAWSYQEGLTTNGYFMLGFPTETEEEMERTIKYALNSKIMIAIFFTVVLYPRLPLIEIAREAYLNFDFSQWNMFDLRYWSEKPFYQRATGVDLLKIQRNAYRRFYFRPKIIFLILWRLPKNRFLIYSIRRGLLAVSISLYKFSLSKLKLR